MVPTFNCNLRCIYCSQSSSEGKKDLDFASFKIFLNEIIKKRVIFGIINNETPHLDLYFTGGGEPTYNWELFYNCVEYSKSICKDNNIFLNLHITTNAYFSKEKLYYLNDNFGSVMISYDGSSEINLKNRYGYNAFDIQDRIKRNIGILSENTDVTIRTTVLPADFHLMQTIADNVFNEFPKIRNLDFKPVFPVGRALMLRGNNENRYEVFLNNFIKLSKDNNKRKVRVTTPIVSVVPTAFGCGGVGSFASEYWLFPDNKIRTCVDSYDDSVVVGEISKGVLNYNDLKTDIFRENIKDNVLQCRTCIALPVCGYGCPLKRIRDSKNGTNYTKNECELQRGYWRYVLKQLIREGKCRGWIANESIIEETAVYNLKYIGEHNI